jgi:hypothetical protein
VKSDTGKFASIYAPRLTDTLPIQHLPENFENFVACEYARDAPYNSGCLAIFPVDLFALGEAFL